MWDDLYLPSVRCTWKLNDWLAISCGLSIVKLSELVVSMVFSEARVGEDDECIHRSQDMKR